MQVSCILCSHYLFYLIDLLLFDFWSIFQVNSSFYCLCANLSILTARYVPPMTPCYVWGRNMLGMISDILFSSLILA